MPRIRSPRVLALGSLLPIAFACKPAGDDDVGDDAESSSSDDGTTEGPDSTGDSTGETTGDTASDTGDTGEPACPADTPAGLMDCVEPQRYFDDLELIAQIRNPGSPGWQEVQDLCADRLESLGYTVQLQNYGTG
ncbi:MAG: hypothetical protein KC431_31570, partial [Myxococcales bacterium]|nr:hypothetical protein [Myxococcales bacterium]